MSVIDTYQCVSVGVQQAASGGHACQGLCSSDARSAWCSSILCNLQAWLLQVSMSGQRNPMPGPAAKLPLLDLRKVEQSHQRQQVEALRRLQCLNSRLQAHIKLAWSPSFCFIGSFSSG